MNEDFTAELIICALVSFIFTKFESCSASFGRTEGVAFLFYSFMMLLKGLEQMVRTNEQQENVAIYNRIIKQKK